MKAKIAYSQPPYEVLFSKVFKRDSYTNPHGVVFEDCLHCNQLLIYGAVWPMRGNTKKEQPVTIEKTFSRDTFSVQQFKTDFGSLNIDGVTVDHLENLYQKGRARLVVEVNPKYPLEFTIVQGRRKQAVLVTPVAKKKQSIYVPCESLQNYEEYYDFSKRYKGQWVEVAPCSMDIALS